MTPDHISTVVCNRINMLMLHAYGYNVYYFMVTCAHSHCSILNTFTEISWTCMSAQHYCLLLQHFRDS